ncbi:MAG: OmpH family outer membrane protein [Nitrospirae bacterium]|nr:OmpH family outer membrane protein [Nitrospirota bacterium]
MRRLSIIFITLFVVIIAFTSAAFAAEGFKVGSIDSDRVQKESKKVNDALKSIEEFAKGKEKLLENDKKELEKLDEDYQKQLSILSPEARKQKEEQIKKRFEEFQKKRATLSDEVRKKNAEASKSLGDKLDTIVKGIGKKEGFDLIVDKRGIHYSRDDFYPLDLTDRIIKEIDSQK